MTYSYSIVTEGKETFINHGFLNKKDATLNNIVERIDNMKEELKAQLNINKIEQIRLYEKVITQYSINMNLINEFNKIIKL